MKERLYGLDALRALLILLGLPFHAALPYAEGAMGMMQANETSGAVGLLVLVLRTFRMPTFFVVAGLFAAMILARRAPETWLVDRLRRLAIPFVAGLVLLKLPTDELVRLFRWETGNRIGAEIATFHHLWFLLTLLLLSLAILAARPALDRGLDRLAEWLERRAGGRGEIAFAGFVALAVLWQWGIDAFFGAVAHLPLIGTLHVTLVYAPWFVFGYGVGRIAGGLAWFARPGAASFVFAAGFLALDVAVARVPNFEAESFAHLAAWTGAGFYIGRLLAALAMRLDIARAPAVRTVVDHAMPIYLLHYPWAMVFAIVFAPTHWAGGTQFLAVMVATGLATAATCFALAGSERLGFLLDGRRRRRRLPAPDFAAATA